MEVAIELSEPAQITQYVQGLDEQPFHYISPKYKWLLLQNEQLTTLNSRIKNGKSTVHEIDRSITNIQSAIPVYQLWKKKMEEGQIIEEVDGSKMAASLYYLGAPEPAENPVNTLDSFRLDLSCLEGGVSTLKINKKTTERCVKRRNITITLCLATVAVALVSGIAIGTFASNLWLKV